MKKPVSFLFVFFLFLGPGFSQSIRILQDNVDVTGKTLTVNVKPDTVYINAFSIYNSSNEKKQFIAHRLLKTKLAAGYGLGFTIHHYQIGPFEDSIQTVPDTLLLEPKAYLNPDFPSSGLSSIFSTGAVSADHLVSYVLETIDGLDKSEVSIHYAYTTGIHELEWGHVSDAYPNPASSVVAVDYSLTSSAKQAHLIVYDGIGKSICSVPLFKKEGQAKVDVEGWAAGIYFYTFVLDGRSLYTGKFAVSHN
jgi:hypothetical protein